MTLQRQDAIDAVTKELSSEEAVVEDWTAELEKHWLMYSQSKRYIETRNDDDLIALGSILIEKATGRIAWLGSSLGREKIVTLYEERCFEFWNPDIVVTAVNASKTAVRLLGALDFRHVIPEVVSGDTFRIPQKYTAEQLRAHLRCLPCRFNISHLLPYRWSQFQELKRSLCVQCHLEENTGFRNQP